MTLRRSKFNSLGPSFFANAPWNVRSLAEPKSRRPPSGAAGVIHQLCNHLDRVQFCDHSAPALEFIQSAGDEPRTRVGSYVNRGTKRILNRFCDHGSAISPQSDPKATLLVHPTARAVDVGQCDVDAVDRILKTFQCKIQATFKIASCAFRYVCSRNVNVADHLKIPPKETTESRFHPAN